MSKHINISAHKHSCKQIRIHRAYVFSISKSWLGDPTIHRLKITAVASSFQHDFTVNSLCLIKMLITSGWCCQYLGKGRCGTNVVLMLNQRRRQCIDIKPTSLSDVFAASSQLRYSTDCLVENNHIRLAFLYQL